MLNIDKLTLGNYQTNCYLVWAEKPDCVVIDPGFEPDRVLARVEELGLKIRAILLTHGHFDHVGGVKSIAEKVGCPVYLHPEDLKLPFPLTRPMGATQDVEDGDELTAAGMTFRVKHTPGHTKGSVCYLAEDVMFSGDTLFAGTCGRTDLPGGSMAQMRTSLAALAALEGNYRVLPGHGRSSDLQSERCTNPFMEG